MGRVIHFELQADDVERATKFYESVLGWKIEKWGGTDSGVGMDYWSITTGSAETPGINGGMYRRPAEGEKFHLYDCTVEVSDLDKAMEAVKANGGMITREKGEIPGVGFFAGAKDTEGNHFGLMQPTDWKPK